MNKRGQGLPLETIIVIILVVIVLIVIAVFFLGGTSSLSKSIRSIFFGTTAGTDEQLAIQNCEQRCEQANNLPKTARATSAFCSFPFNIDKDKDGEADKDGDNFVKYYCYKASETTDVKSLNIFCANKEDGTRLTC